MSGAASPITAAVVGTGFIGPVHVEGLRRAGVRVAGILGSSEAKSRAAAERLQLDKAYADFDQVLADPEVQSVHLTTPNRFHFQQASAALQADKHVMCEKPLAMNTQQSRQLVQMAADAEVAAGVNYNIRYYPLCLEAAARAADGRLGKVYHVAGSYVQDWMFHATDFNWRVLADEGGELRAVADIGTHWLDLVWSITRLEVEAVCADLQTVFPQRYRPSGGSETFSGQAGTAGEKTDDADTVAITTDDCGSVLLRFRGGARGVLWVSQVTAGRKNCLRFEMAGERETLAWNSEQPNELWIGRRDEPNQSLLRDPALMGETARSHADYPGGHNEGFPDTFKQCFRDFYDYIAAGDFSAPPTFPTFADGHREIALCEAILASHRRQGWVQLEEFTK